jgi:hypothetical protein
MGQHDHQRGGYLPRYVTFGLLADGKSPCGNVVLHHGAFFQLMPDGVRMIGAGGLKKLLEVIGGLPHLVLEVMLSGSNELLIEIVGLLVIVTLIIVGSDYDSLGSPLWPPFVAFGAPLCTLATFPSP